MPRVNGFTLLQAAVRAKDVSGTTKSVLEQLCNHCDSSATCFPSLETLARETGRNRRTVIRAISSLVASGHVVKRGPKRPGGAQVYEISLEKLGLVAPSPVPEAEEAAAPAPVPAQAPRQDPAAQTLTRVLEALDALTRRVEAMERTLARMAESQGAPVEVPKPVAPVTECAEGKADEKPEQLSLGLGDSTPKWDAEDGFSRFWAAWPDKQDKQRARKAFGKVMAKQKDPEAHLQLMLSVIARKKTERKWREGIYMQAATFLNNARWNDEPEKERAGRNDAEFLHATTEEEDDLIARMEGRA